MQLTITIKDVTPPKSFNNSARDISALNKRLIGALAELNYALPAEGGYFYVEVQD